MKLYQKIIIFLSSLICLTLIFLFKTLPTGKLWNNYKILYVPVETNDSIIKKALKDSKIKDYVSLNNQFLPVLLNENSPEISIFKANYTDSKYSYYLKRNSYFYDKSNNFRLYYIPNSYKNKLNNCIKILNDENIKAGTDSNSAYPWFIPVIVMVFASILCYFSKNKLLFGLSAVLPVIFVFCNPFFSIMISIFIVLLCLFFVSNIWKREGAVKYLTSNYFIIILAAAALICSFGSSFKSGLLFIICLTGTVAFVISYKNVEDYFQSKKSFNPVLIKSAKHKSLFANQSKTVSSALLFFTVLSVFLLFLTSSSNLNSHFSKLLLPAPKGIESEELPALNDYCEWMWNVKSSPYISLNKKASTENEIIYPRFTENNGIVVTSYDKLTYDQKFIENVYSEIDQLNFNAIEKVLKSEKVDYHGSYAATSSTVISVFGIIAILFILFMLLFMFISIMIGKGIIK